MNTKLRLALILGMLFVICVSMSYAEEGQAEPEPSSEPESEPTAEEDAKGAGSTVGKTGESKAGPNNPAPGAPVALPATIMFAMALVAKYIL